MEQHDRVAQIEYISHTGLISKLYGGEPFKYPNEALAKTYEKLDLDMIFWTLQSYSPCERAKEKGRSFSIRTDSWSELFPTTWRSHGAFSVSSVEDVLNYEPEEEVALSRDRLDEVVDYFSREHEKVQDLFKAQLVPGGYYCTTFMWPVMTFGLEWTLKTAGRDPKGFEKLKIKGIVVLFCSDGNITSIVDDLAEAGADGFIMEPRCDLGLITEKYGAEKVLVGNVDLKVLTFGDEKAIMNEVFRSLTTCGHCPGYFINATGSIPDNVPLQSLESYFEICRKHRLRPLRKLIGRQKFREL